MSRSVRLVFIGLILVGAGLYHSNGMNDWLTPQAVQEGVTLAQATNEVIASVLLCTAMLLAFIEFRKPPESSP